LIQVDLSVEEKELLITIDEEELRISEMLMF